MIKGKAVYQRTESGREEIRRKTHGLTQSERLVLILVDGVANTDAVRHKLKGISDERFSRALNKLVRNNLVQEVLMPMPDQEAETVDDSTADLFLRQDALDPVTIISADPEDEYDSVTPQKTEASFGRATVSPAGTVDLHLWKSKNAADSDPFPAIRTESRISPPADLKPLHDPYAPRKIPGFATAEPMAKSAATAAPLTFDALAERHQPMNNTKTPNSPVEKSGPIWLFWIMLTTVSILTAAFILFY